MSMSYTITLKQAAQDHREQSRVPYPMDVVQDEVGTVEIHPTGLLPIPEDGEVVIGRKAGRLQLYHGVFDWPEDDNDGDLRDRIGDPEERDQPSVAKLAPQVL